MSLEKSIAQLLSNHRKSLSVAESCTGGLLAKRLTDIPGSSQFFKLGIVVYSNDAKKSLLKIPEKMLKDHGAISEPVAKLLASKVRQILDTDFGIGITGIAGPGGGTKTKPVGLTFIAVSTRYETLCYKCHFKGSRGKIRRSAVDQALTILLKSL